MGVTEIQGPRSAGSQGFRDPGVQGHGCRSSGVQRACARPFRGGPAPVHALIASPLRFAGPDIPHQAGDSAVSGLGCGGERGVGQAGALEPKPLRPGTHSCPFQEGATTPLHGQAQPTPLNKLFVCRSLGCRTLFVCVCRTPRGAWLLSGLIGLSD